MTSFPHKLCTARLAAGALALVIGVAGCTGDGKKKAHEPVASRPEAKHPAPAPMAPVVPVPVAPPPPPEPDPCLVLEKLPHEPPVYAPGRGVVLTKFGKTCTTRDGRSGIEPNTPWLAMGIPCTGGQGRVDIKGHYHNPKMVSFIVGTDCGMSPATKERAAQAVREALALPAEARLMAYTPFVLQYWEVVGMEDADTGFAIELRSVAAIEGLWSKVRNNQTARVRLFGRENSWGQGENFYFVEADVRLAGRTTFQLEVTQVKALSKDEIAEVKARCEALRPARSCSAVF